MKKLLLLALLFCALPAFAKIEGDYIETRSADVWTGACTAMGEVNLMGDQAILGWRIRQGDFEGVRLDGLSIVVVVKARATLGDPKAAPYPAKAVFIVDDLATPQQRAALVRFAQEMGGEMLQNVVRVESAPIQLRVTERAHHSFVGILRAGDLAAVETRPLSEKDHFCGNEETYYPPLTQVAHAMPGIATVDQFTGTGLDVTWSASGRRSAFVGTFAR